MSLTLTGVLLIMLNGWLSGLNLGDWSWLHALPLGELGEKWKSFGWNVFEVPGHDFSAMHDAIAAAKARRGSGKPSVLLLHTRIGSGVDFMENQSSWHGKAPNDEQLQKALSQLPPTRYGDF